VDTSDLVDARERLSRLANVDTRIVTTTVDSREAAASLSEGAVRARLAACGQVSGPITSTFWWNGALDTAEEFTVTFKTPAEHANQLVEHLRAAHPYDVPEILVTPVTGGNPAYLSWVAEETREQS
jgi:periplasmic divalent cation tolerance protein